VPDIITTGSSGYASGSLDTATTLINNVSPHSATHINGVASAVTQVENILGSGIVLKGSQPDLGTRLAAGVNSTGTLKTTALDGVNTVAQGGTGRSTLTENRVLVGNTVGLVDMVTGLVYHGPTTVGAGSTVSHEGTVTISSSQAHSGIHFYTDFTLNAAQTLTIADAAHRLIIVATGTITINGTIDGIGAGSVANATTELRANGFSQPGGGGGGNVASTNAIAGGSTLIHGVIAQLGGSAGGVGVTGGTGAQQLGASLPIGHPFSIMGGGGGGNTLVAGGVGGASIVLIATTIVLGAAAVFNTSGTAGASGDIAGRGGAGGGGAGNVYMFCRTFTDSGATFTMTGGAAGLFHTTGANGGAGASGVKQINIHA